MNQTYPNIEILVVDDGSTTHRERLTPYMDRINYISKGNGGTASALNHGFRLSTGEYIAWLSSDDMFYPAKIERQVGFMKQHKAKVSYTDYHIINAAGEVTHHNATAKFATVRSFAEAFISYCPINGCTVMASKEYMRSIGYFNEQLPFTHDYDLWIRMVLGRTPIYYLDEPLTAYRRHEEMGTIQHSGAIAEEVKAVQSTYQLPLQMMLNTL